MQKIIDLKEYKGSKQYFLYFDYLIKINNYVKDDFLERNGISPSSYRRARKVEQKIGEAILEQLEKCFGFEPLTLEMINHAESFINRIYTNVVYKNFDTYEEDLKEAELLLTKKTLLHPILKLTYLFMLNAVNQDINALHCRYSKLYQEVSSYVSFFNQEIMKMYNLLYLSYEPILTREVSGKEYDDHGLSYYVLASRKFIKGEYIESLYFCNRAKAIFHAEENVKRIAYINITIISNYCGLGKYEECFETAQRQYWSLSTIKDFTYEFKTTLRYLLLSLLAMKKYGEIFKYIDLTQKIKMTEACIVLSAKYKMDPKTYMNYFNKEVHMDELTEKERECFTQLNQYLFHGNKNFFKHVNGFQINVFFPIILKLIKEE